MKRSLSAAFLLFLSGISATIFAADLPASQTPGVEADSNTANARIPTLREVISTADRSDRDARQVPASVSVIPRDEIDAAPAQNVDDLLRTLTGLDVKRVAGMGSGLPDRLSIRGVPGYNRTLLLMDGIPVNAAGTDFMSTNEVPLDIMDRIEVVRGPFSGLYGSNAFGGVVNMITRDPSLPWTGSESNSYGNYGLRETSGSLSGTEGPVGLFLQADQRSIDNIFARNYRIDREWNDATQSFDVTNLPVTNFGYDDDRYFGKMTIKPCDSTILTLHGLAFRDRLGFGETMFLPDPQDVSVENRSGLGAMELDSKLSDQLEIEASGYGRRRFEHILNESFDSMIPTPPYFLYDYTSTDTMYWDWQGELRAVWRPHPDHVLTFGVDTLYNEGRFNPARLTSDGTFLDDLSPVRHSLHDTGAYVQEEWTLGRFQLVPGVRADHNGGNGWTDSPKLGVLYNASDSFRLRSSAGLAFRAPTLSELYMPDVSSYGGMIIKSNPLLKPEYVDAYDFGMEKDLRKNLTLGVDAFTNAMRDLITNVISYPDILYSQVNRARSNGFDATLTWRPVESLKCGLNYTYQWAEDCRTRTLLDYMPLNKGNATLVYSHLFGKWRLEGNLQECLSGTRYYTVIDDELQTHHFLLSDYACTNLGLKADWKGAAYVELNLENAFNAKYEETYSYLSPGRMVELGAGLSF